MTEDRLRLGAIELKMAGDGSLLVRATDIDHVIVARVRDPVQVAQIRERFHYEYQHDYGMIPVGRERDLERLIRQVPLVDKCTVVLRSQAKHEVLNSKEELLNVIRDS